MNAKVLIVEDVKELSDLVALYLKKEGVETKQAESGEDALSELRGFEADLIILDINLPGMDGFEFLHEYRKTGTKPVLIVSARDADEDIIMGLGYGADEFVTKPFSPRVLVARIRAILRRVQDMPENRNDTVRFGPFSLDLETCVLKRRKEPVVLSAKEYGVLAYLASNPGKPLSPGSIYAAVWKNAYGDVTAVAVYVQRLRKKLEAVPSEPRYIETVFGMGYRLNLVLDAETETP